MQLCKIPRFKHAPCWFVPRSPLLELSNPVLFCLIYRPPKSNRDFITDFSDFVASVMCRSDRIFILGDFNIHICWPSKPLVREFLHLVDSFNLVQSVTGSTHQYGHTLDLILSLGFPFSNSWKMQYMSVRSLAHCVWCHSAMHSPLDCTLLLVFLTLSILPLLSFSQMPS